VSAATDLVLVRHGATRTTGAGLVDGRSDPPLSDEGRAQARRTADRLAAALPAGIFVTPLRRTAQTAEPLADRTQVVPHTVAALIEVHVGTLETQLERHATRTELLRAVLRAGRWDVGDGGEPPEWFAARVRDGLREVAQCVGPGETAVVFTHGGVIAEACRQATGSTTLAFLPYLAPASISRLASTAKRLSLVCFNDVAHLARGEAATNVR
jgi:probable phosphoglycerate mutase